MIKRVSLAQGQVQVCTEGEWTSICSENWDVNEANVVCRQLGYTIGGEVLFVGALFSCDGIIVRSTHE